MNSVFSRTYPTLRASPNFSAYRSIDHQTALCTGGFGANPNSRGRAVYCKNLFSGEMERWRRGDIAGTLSEDRLPDWARANLATLREASVKEAPAALPPPLDKERFWRIIDDARKAAGTWQDMLEPLTEAVSRLEEPNIVRFKQIYDEYLNLAYKEKLWAAAAVIYNGCSDDGFLDFRVWLIAQGKDVYLSALADPDSLADLETVRAFERESRRLEYMPPDGCREAASFESMTYAASYAYERKFGKDADLHKLLGEFPLTDKEKADIAGEIICAADIDVKWTGHGKPWPEITGELRRLCPKLYRAFREPARPNWRLPRYSVTAKRSPCLIKSGGT